MWRLGLIIPRRHAETVAVAGPSPRSIWPPAPWSLAFKCPSAQAPCRPPLNSPPAPQAKSFRILENQNISPGNQGAGSRSPRSCARAF